MLKIIDSINEFIGKAVSFMLVLLTLLVVYEVVMRRLIGSPTIWTFEISKQLYGCYFMLMAGYALLHGSHISVDVIYSAISTKKQALCDVFSYLVFFFPFCIVILIEGTKYAASSWMMCEKSPSIFAPPLYPIKTIIPVMAFLLLIQGIAVFVRRLEVALGREQS